MTFAEWLAARDGANPCSICNDSTILFAEDFIGAVVCAAGIIVDGDFFWNFSSFDGNGSAEIIADEVGHKGIVRLHESSDADPYSETFLDIKDDNCSFGFDQDSSDFQGHEPQICDSFNFSVRWHPGTAGIWDQPLGSLGPKNNIRFGFSQSPDVNHSFQHCSTESGLDFDTPRGAYFRSCDKTGNWLGVVDDIDNFGVNTEINTGVAVLPDEWQCFKITRIDANTIGFSVDGSTNVTITGINASIFTNFNAQTYFLLGGIADGTAYLDVDYAVIANRDCTIPCEPGDLPSVSLCQGQSVTQLFNITDIGTFSDPVTLTATGLANGMTVIFTPNPSTGAFIILIETTDATPLGTTTITITGNDGFGPESKTMDVIVSDCSVTPGGRFVLSRLDIYGKPTWPMRPQ